MKMDSSSLRIFPGDSHELLGLRSTVLGSFTHRVTLQGGMKKRVRGGRVRSEGKHEEEVLDSAGVSVAKLRA